VSQVEVEIEGPVMENLARVTVTDREASDSLHLDWADVEEAEKAGVHEILRLIIENAQSTIYDILDAAVVNGTPLTVDGKPVDLDVLATAFDKDTGSLVARGLTPRG